MPISHFIGRYTAHDRIHHKRWERNGRWKIVFGQSQNESAKEVQGKFAFIIYESNTGIYVLEIATCNKISHWDTDFITLAFDSP